MKFALVSFLLAILAAFAGAVSQQKPVVVSYPKGTDQSVLDAAMQAIRDAGGVITHEYNLIKGFAAKASEEALDAVHSLGQQNNVVIEEDKIYHVNEG